MKKEYTKPTMKVMELTYNDVICASNLCIRIEQNGTSSSTHVESFRQGSLDWNTWKNNNN